MTWKNAFKVKFKAINFFPQNYITFFSCVFFFERMLPFRVERLKWPTLYILI